MSSIEKAVERDILRCIADHGVDPAEGMLIAYSGGPDSTALLHAAAAVLPKWNGCRFSAAYVNHKLRDQSRLRQEMAHVKSFCAGGAIPLHILECRDGEIARHALSEDCGIEAAARTARYRLLFHCMQQHGLRYLMTAHTADDQEETVVMRFFQGSGPEGLRGIPEVSQDGSVLRPLLHLSKDAIHSYLEACNLPWHTDETNHENRFLRNRIRLLMPEIEQVFPGFRKSLEVLQEKMSAVVEHTVTVEQERLYAQALQVADISSEVSFSLHFFLQLDRYNRWQFLRFCWNRLEHDFSERLSYQTVRPLLFLNSDELQRKRGNRSGSTRVRLLEVGSTTCCADATKFFWVVDVVHKQKNKYLKVVRDDSTRLPGNVLLECRKALFDRESTDIWINSEILQNGCIARSVLDGDCITTVHGTKAVSKLFNEWRIPPDMRWKIPILEDTEGVIAVLGSQYGGKNRISDRVTALPNVQNDLIMVRVVITGR